MIIPVKTAEMICVELDNILERIEKGEFEFKTELEDIHMNIESALIAKLGDEGARVHSARSRNDQVALDMRMYVRSEITELKGAVKALLLELHDLIQNHGGW